MAACSSIIEARYEVRSSDGLIILDVENDTYSCTYDPLPCEMAVDLTSPSPVPMAPWIELPAPVFKTLRTRDLAYFFRALAGATIDFRTKAFSDLLRDEATRRALAPPSDIEAIALAANRFSRFARWCPFQFQCLFRAIFLLRFLRLYGLTADWVFGATLFPFEAHCWLAAGRHLLTDRPERLLRFKTLLAIDGRSE